MKIPKGHRWITTGKTLGEGGHAQIFEVTDSTCEYQGKYALKALSSSKSKQAYDRFHREIAAIKGLNHHSIIKVVDSSKKNDSFQYYVMELIEGVKTLKNIIFSCDSPFICNPVASLDLFIHLAEAIFICEKNEPKVVHRDLSPANILIEQNRNIKIIDFGVCQIEGDATITLTDEGVGTANYMAPECESGAEGEIGTHSDLYSAGKILWAAVTGKNAFARETPAFTSKSMSKMFPDNPDLLHLYHVFAKTIRHNPKDRYGSAKDAIAEAQTVKRLILRGYPAIEEIFDRCPLCGFGLLEDFDNSRAVFGNPNPRGINAKQCTYCGVCLAINYDKIRDTIKTMESLY